VLTITLPKTAEAQRAEKKITVKAECSVIEFADAQSLVRDHDAQSESDMRLTPVSDRSAYV
jgi:hypothetical protein